MDDPNPSQQNIRVACDDATDEELERLTRQLRSYPRETPIESSELASDVAASAASKGDAIMTGSIVVKTLPTVLPVRVSPVQGWIPSGPGRTARFKSKDFEFEGPPEQLEKLSRERGGITSGK